VSAGPRDVPGPRDAGEPRAAAAAAEPLLSVSRLDGWYGRAQILREVSLSVGAGEVVENTEKRGECFPAAGGRGE
jgi:hypothetical protein